MSETGDNSLDLTDSQKRYFQTIFNYFEEHGAWPTFAQVERILDDSGSPDAEEIAKEIGRTLFSGFYMPWSQPNAEVKLPLRVVAACDGSEHLMQLVLDTVRLAYLSWKKSDSVRISSKQLQDGWEVSDHDIQRLGLLLVDGGVDFWTGFGSADESGAWFMAVGRGIRRYRDVKTVGQLLDALPALLGASPQPPAVLFGTTFYDPQPIDPSNMPRVIVSDTPADIRIGPLDPGKDRAVSRVFISYRRDDSTDISGRIYDRLRPKYGRDNVFKDVESIPLGVDFRRVLAEEVAKCDVMLVIIGRQWVTIVDESGQRRLDNPADFVRIEVEAALPRGVPVIPVLIQDARMPKVEDLPATLGDLAYRNGIIIHGDPYFHQDMNLLIRHLDALVIDPPVSPPVKDEQDPPWARCLRRERQSNRWTQIEVAERLGISLKSVQSYESGTRHPGETAMQKLCLLYGKTPRELGFSV